MSLLNHQKPITASSFCIGLGVALLFIGTSCSPLIPSGLKSAYWAKKTNADEPSKRTDLSFNKASDSGPKSAEQVTNQSPPVTEANVNLAQEKPTPLITLKEFERPKFETFVFKKENTTQEALAVSSDELTKLKGKFISLTLGETQLSEFKKKRQINLVALRNLRIKAARGFFVLTDKLNTEFPTEGHVEPSPSPGVLPSPAISKGLLTKTTNHDSFTPDVLPISLAPRETSNETVGESRVESIDWVLNWSRPEESAEGNGEKPPAKPTDSTPAKIDDEKIISHINKVVLHLMVEDLNK